jgi:hypothetical protein
MFGMVQAMTRLAEDHEVGRQLLAEAFVRAVVDLGPSSREGWS